MKNEFDYSVAYHPVATNKRAPFLTDQSVGQGFTGLPSLLNSFVNRPCFILIVESNPDQRLLIGYSLRASIPQAEPVFITTSEEVLQYLHKCSANRAAFPKLVLLTIYPSQQESGWALLKELRATYPCLLVLVLSAHRDPKFVKQAYELGAHSFIAKPRNLEAWEIQFKLLSMYWLGVVTLPPVY